MGAETLQTWSWIEDQEIVLASVTSQCNLASLYHLTKSDDVNDAQHVRFNKHKRTPSHNTEHTDLALLDCVNN